MDDLTPPYTLTSIDLMEQLSYYLTTEVRIPNELIITVIETVTGEIEGLRSQVRSQALELLVAHSEALGLYDITMVCHTPDETDAIRQQHGDYVEEARHG